MVSTLPTGATKVSQMVNSIMGTAAAPAIPVAISRTKSRVWISVSFKP